MPYKIVINDKKTEKYILVYENNTIVEQYIETAEDYRNEGNIYIGIVKDLVKGIQSAFIDIGTGKNALIQLKDLIPKKSDLTGNKEIDLSNYKLSDFIKQGDKVLVQVKRDGTKNKGAIVTKEIKLVGQYSILMPLSKFATLSSKIEDEKERIRLKEMLELIMKELNIPYGIILRTSAYNKEKEEIIKDIKNLINEWEKIQKYKDIENKPQLVYTNNGILGKLITDLEPFGVEIVTNSTNVKKAVNEVEPKIEVEINNKIDDKVNYPQKVWLKCGGYIIIEKTEALISIDVNSGKYTGKKVLQDTLFKVNKEAAEEIANQLRLQDLGGIIIIDFINMNNEQNKEKIEEILRDKLKQDRSKVQLVEFTKLGLLELTRKSIYRK